MWERRADGHCMDGVEEMGTGRMMTTNSQTRQTLLLKPNLLNFTDLASHHPLSWRLQSNAHGKQSHCQGSSPQPWPGLFKHTSSLSSGFVQVRPLSQLMAGNGCVATK